MAQRRLGAEVPEFRQKFPVLLGAPVVPKAQIWNSKKICLGPPPPLNRRVTLTEKYLSQVNICRVDRLAWARGLSSQKYFKNTFGSSPPKGSPIYTNNDQKPGPSNKGPSPTKPGPFTPKMLSVMRSAGSSLSSGSPVSKWFPFHSSTPPGVK